MEMDRGWGWSEMGMLQDPCETGPRKEAREEGKEFAAGMSSFECWWEVPQPGAGGGACRGLREQKKLTPLQASWLWFLELQCSGSVSAPHQV